MTIKSSQELYPWLFGCYSSLLPRVTQQSLHHGLLFVSDEGCGESSLIHLLAKTILCSSKNACGHCKSCLLFDALSHPDLLIVTSDKPSIGVDAIRQVSEFVTSTSQLLGNKLVIIEDIERMTDSASNALLKTLEEPNNNTYVLLSTNKPHNLLATIKSRCEKIRLNLPNTKESLHWLASKTDKQVNELGLQAYSGSPINYLASLTSTDSDTHGDFVGDVSAMLNQHLSPLELSAKWQTQGAIILAWCYQLQVSLQQGLLSENESLGDTNLLNIEGRFDYELLVRATYSCQQAYKPINQAGINKALILQRVFTEFKQCLI